MDFSKQIISWYNVNKRPLPWRKSNDPYRIWLSEIMLQQTRVEQGMPYYFKFTEKYPTVFDLAEAPENEVLKLWQGLGYYSRARNLHKTAQTIAGEFNGKFPESYAELKKLKGVGDYTASAIASFCFKIPAPVVDGNVYRVLSRFFGVDIPINSTSGIRYFKKLAEELIDGENPGEYNQGIMEFGAIQCKPKSPDCNTCPLNNKCVALEKGLVNELPVKLKKTKIKKRYFNYLVLLDGDKTVLNQRKGKGIWQNLYEFPLIETMSEANESVIVAHDVLKKYVGTNRYSISLYNEEEKVHKLSHQHIYTKFWIVHLQASINNGIPNTEIEDYPVPVLIANFVEEYGF